MPTVRCGGGSGILNGATVFGVLRLQHGQVCDLDNRAGMPNMQWGGWSGFFKEAMIFGYYDSNIYKTLWPCGLRHWLKAQVRKGAGSHPTGVIAKIYEPGTSRFVTNAQIHLSPMTAKGALKGT